LIWPGSYGKKILLVGGLEHEFYFSIQLEIIIPTDELIFFRGVGHPPPRMEFTLKITIFNGKTHFEWPCSIANS
jgi:hypothetical protein